MKVSTYKDDLDAYANMQRLLAENKVVGVALDGVELNPLHVFGANEEAGTVEIAVLGPTGQLQADPRYPPEIQIVHNRKQLQKEKGYKKTRPKVIPSRMLTKTMHGIVKITITDAPPAPVVEANK
jgi:hypothetical protein